MAIVQIDDHCLNEAQSQFGAALIVHNLQQEMILEDFVKNLDRITPEKMDAFIKSL